METGKRSAPSRVARRRRLGVVALLCLLLADDAYALRLRGLQQRERGGATEVLLRLDAAPPAVEVTLLPDRRVVVDLPGATADLARRRMDGRGPCLTRVRIGEHPDYTRVVLDLARDCAHQHRIEGDTVIVRLAAASGGARAASQAAEPEPREPTRPTSRARPRRGVLLPASGVEPAPERAPGGVLLPGVAVPPGDGDPAMPAGGSGAEEDDLESVGTLLEPAVASSESDGPVASPDRGVVATEPSPRAAATGPGPAGRAATGEPTSEPVPTPVPSPPASPAPTRSLRPVVIAEPSAARSGEPSTAPTSSPEARDDARVSIEFEDADVRTVLDLLARAGGRQVIFRPEVQGRVGVKAVDQPWRGVFEQVLRRADLEAVEHDGLFLISPARR